jgi:double-strand break repair protein MRE11
VIRFMFMTDSHLGFKESDVIRGNDSFEVFSEALSIAQTESVDFVIHGGDLFHLNLPSKHTMDSTMRILWEKCVGNDPIFVQSHAPTHGTGRVNDGKGINYYSPHINIAMPMFVIHGNHDEPTHGSSPLKTLGEAHLINYFGVPKSASFECTPILMQKRSAPNEGVAVASGPHVLTRMALYGMGYMSDSIVRSLFSSDSVKIVQPDEVIPPSDEALREKWGLPVRQEEGRTPLPSFFNVFVMHQTREMRGADGVPGAVQPIRESLLGTSLHLLLRGHEHKHRSLAIGRAPMVLLPGSANPDGWSSDEANCPRYVAVVEVFRSHFRYKWVRLRTPRRFVFRDLRLDDEVSQQDTSQSHHSMTLATMPTMTEEEILARVKSEFIKILTETCGIDVNAGRPLHAKDRPIIRIRVSLGERLPTFDPSFVRREYKEFVANPNDVIRFTIRRSRAKSSKFSSQRSTGSAGREEEIAPSEIDKYIEDILKTKKEFHILDYQQLQKGLKNFVLRGDKRSLQMAVSKCVEEWKEALVKKLDESCAQEGHEGDLEISQSVEEEARKDVELRRAHNVEIESQAEVKNESIGVDSEGKEAGEGDSQTVKMTPEKRGRKQQSSSRATTTRGGRRTRVRRGQRAGQRPREEKDMDAGDGDGDGDGDMSVDGGGRSTKRRKQ